MTRKRSFLSLLAFLALVGMLAPGAVLAQSAEQKGYNIAKAAAARDNGYRDFTASGQMVLRDSGGGTSTRRFDFKSLEASSSSDMTLLVFNWPGDIRDTALLTHTYGSRQDDQWLYLPALRRAKRISSSARSGSFVGSEFAYEDMTNQEVDKYTYKWIADEACPGGGGQCHVIDRFPKYSSGYSRQRVWLDTSAYRIRRVYFYDRRGSHLKTLVTGGYRQYSGRFWKANSMRMVNHLTGKSTDLVWQNYRFGTGLSRNDFSVNALKNLR